MAHVEENKVTDKEKLFAAWDAARGRRYEYNRRNRPHAYSSDWLEVPCSDRQIEDEVKEASDAIAKDFSNWRIK